MDELDALMADAAAANKKVSAWLATHSAQYAANAEAIEALRAKLIPPNALAIEDPRAQLVAPSAAAAASAAPAAPAVATPTAAPSAAGAASASPAAPGLIGACALPSVFYYVCAHERTPAPCVADGLATLALCKPLIRTRCVPGDWIVGICGKYHPDADTARHGAVRYAAEADHTDCSTRLYKTLPKALKAQRPRPRPTKAQREGSKKAERCRTIEEGAAPGLAWVQVLEMLEGAGSSPPRRC
jgi:hypothetical protein